MHDVAQKLQDSRWTNAVGGLACWLRSRAYEGAYKHFEVLTHSDCTWCMAQLLGSLLLLNQCCWPLLLHQVLSACMLAEPDYGEQHPSSSERG